MAEFCEKNILITEFATLSIGRKVESCRHENSADENIQDVASHLLVTRHHVATDTRRSNMQSSAKNVSHFHRQLVTTCVTDDSSSDRSTE